MCRLDFFGKRKQYQIPHLVFKNDAETMFVKIGSYPSLFSYKKDESFNNPDLHYLSIIEPEKYEYELKKEIERKENDRKEECEKTGMGGSGTCDNGPFDDCCFKSGKQSGKP